MTTWTGAGKTTSWDDAGNWSGTLVPSPYGAVTIGIAGLPVAVAVAGQAGARAASLTVGDGHANETVQLSLSGTFLLDGSGILVSGGASLATTGGAINLSAGGLAVQAGGGYTETGGTLAASTLSNHGATVLTGAVSVAGSLDNAGTLTESGTLTAQSGIDNTGTMTLAGTVLDASDLANTGQATLSGTATIGGTLSNAGTAIVTGAVNLLGEAIAGTGAILVNGGRLGTAATPISVIGSQSFTLENNGFLFLRDGLGTSSVTFGSGANTVSVQNNISIVTMPIRNFGAGDRIEVEANGITGDAVIANNNNSYTIALESGAFYDPVVLTNVTLAPGIKASQIALSVSGGEATVFIACFLSGTRIATAAGEVVVEDIAVGDQVVAVENDRRTLRPVRWHGSRTVCPARMSPEDARDAAPVRIRADAFAPGIPSRDLLITPEHCVLVDGRLVPARMLVNGSSIVRETSRRSFTVHHIECDRHAILLSEGLTTESYLDTGNRHGFGTAADDATADPSAWANAAAPLDTARSFVEPIWRRLATRAAAIGLPVPVTSLCTTADPCLRIRLDDNSLLAASRSSRNRHFFVLPPGTRRVAIVSRTFVPALVEGPFVDDRRRLGVAVKDARLWIGLQTRTLPVGDSAKGWHAAEPGAEAVWTDGAGLLDVEPGDGPTVLQLELVLAARYLTDTGTARRQAA